MTEDEMAGWHHGLDERELSELRAESVRPVQGAWVQPGQGVCVCVCVCVCVSRSVMSDSLRPQELQHTRPPCPSKTPRVLPNSCPSSW